MRASNAFLRASRFALALFACFAATTFAQPRQALIRVAVPPDPIYTQAIAQLQSELRDVAKVESIGTAATAQTIERLQRGDGGDVAIVSFAALGALFPKFRVFDLPFTFADSQAMLLFAQQRGRNRLLADLQQQGLGALDIWYGGTIVVASRQPVRSPRDFKGGKLIVRSEQTGKQFASIGASPTTVAYAEIYTALQSGVADAAEVGWQLVPQLTEVLGFVTETNHRYAGYAAVYNRSNFDSLPQSVREKISRTVSDISQKVSFDVRAREDQAKKQAEQSGRMVDLKVNVVIRNEWRQALAPSQAAEIERIGVDFVTAARQGFETAGPVNPFDAPALQWNAWFQGSPSDVRATLAKSNAYRFILDLGRGGYPGALTGDISRAAIEEINKDPTKDEVPLLIRPILMGGILTPTEGTSFGARVFRVKRARLAAEPRNGDLRAQLQDKRITLEQFAKELSVGEPIFWDVTARETGCARVALSVWDVAGLRPLDYIVVTVPVGKAGEEAPRCGPGLDGGKLVAGLSGLLSIGADTSSAPRQADAALHLFDSSPGGDANTTTVAVFVDRAEFQAAEAASGPPALYAWELDTDFSKFLGQPIKLPKSIENAHAAFRTDNTPYRDVVRQMSSALFSGRSEEDQRNADNARKSMQRLSDRENAPIILVRYFGAFGDLRYVPLALLAADAPERVLPRRVTIVQPLWSAREIKPEACFGEWDLAIPRELDGIVGDDKELLQKSDWRMSGDRIAWYEDNTSLLKFLADPKPQATGAALVLLAHHGEGTVTFSSTAHPERIFDSDVHRVFQPGSVAVLAACSTAGVSTDSRAFVQQLINHKIEAFVVSPFQVDTTFGTRLAINFVATANEARSRNETPRLVDFFDRAVLKTMATFKDRAGYKDMALEFQIIGNHELRLCRASP